MTSSVDASTSAAVFFETPAFTAIASTISCFETAICGDATSTRLLTCSRCMAAAGARVVGRLSAEAVASRPSESTSWSTKLRIADDVT
eukprot:773165-Prymnesium_polylepis.1